MKVNLILISLQKKQKNKKTKNKFRESEGGGVQVSVCEGSSSLMRALSTMALCFEQHITHATAAGEEVVDNLLGTTGDGGGDGGRGRGDAGY